MGNNAHQSYDDEGDWIPYTADGIKRQLQWDRVGRVIISCGRSNNEAIEYAKTYNGEGAPTYKGDDKYFVFDGFDFKFKIETVMNGEPKGTADVSILGLSLDTMNQLVSLTSLSDSLIKGKRLQVYAGYADPDDPDYVGEKIIDCDVQYAEISSSPPEMWFHVIGMVGNRLKGQEISINLPDKNTISQLFRMKHIQWDSESGKGEAGLEVESMYTFKELCEDIVKKINTVSDKWPQETRVKVELEIQAKDEYMAQTVDQFNENCSLLELISKLNDINSNVHCFLLPERTQDKKDGVSVEKLCIVDAKYKEKADRLIDSKKRINVKYLSTETGLVGLPSVVQANNLKCRCLLDPSLRQGDRIMMRSEVIPCINSKQNTNVWMINSVTHSGHIRGNEWYTDITAYDVVRSSIEEMRQREMLVKDDNG